MDEDMKRRLKSDFKAKLPTGAVYSLVCSEGNRRWLKSTTDIAGIKNRFAFALASKGCPDPAARAEWLKFGTDSFSLVVHEELKMKETQTQREFADDIGVLLELWKEKDAAANAK